MRGRIKERGSGLDLAFVNMMLLVALESLAVGVTVGAVTVAEAVVMVVTVVAVVAVEVLAVAARGKREALLKGAQESSKPAPSMRLSKFTLYLLPKHVREEWLGDLEEARQEMLKAGYWRIAVALITYGRLGLLLWSLVRIKLSDLVPGKNTPGR